MVDIEVQRKSDGTFAKGSSGNPHGRPPKAREIALLNVAYEEVNADRWRMVVRKRLHDALGVKPVETKDANGKVVRVDLVTDPDSTAQGRNAAAAWLRDTIIGRPTEFVSPNLWESPYEQIGAYTDEQLEQLNALLNDLRSRAGIADDSGSGAGSPEP